MKSAPTPVNEKERLKALSQYEVLDTPSEDVFDELTALAAGLCNTPIATITLIDEDREWYKSKIGIEDKQAPRDISFCAHTILQDDLMIVPDTFKDERFYDNPFVLEDPPLRFYAGAPLVTPEGHSIGTLCVIDHVPRRLKNHQKNALRILAHCIVTQLESRRMTTEILETREALLNSHHKLEERVKERTAELSQINIQLQEEIARREQAEEVLLLESEMLSNMTEGVILTRASDGIIIHTNPQFERIFGYGPNELVGRHVSILNAPTDMEPEEMAKNIIDILNEKGEWSGETKNVKKDGTIFWCRANVSTFEHSEYGTVWLAVHIDITDRKQTEKDLRIASFAMDHAADCIYWINTDAGFIYVNNSACEELGYTRTEMLTMHVYDINPHITRKTWKERWELIKANKYIHIESQHRTKDGRIIDIDLQANYLEFEGKEYVCAVVRDISERKRQQNLVLNVAKGVSAKTGQSFFISLVEYIATTLGADFVSVCELEEGETQTIMKTKAVWMKDRLGENFIYDVSGTPCERVVKEKQTISYLENIAQVFPADTMFQELNIEAYVSVPLFDSSSKLMGSIAVCFKQPLQDSGIAESVLQIFATRASAELERQRFETRLKISEEKFFKAFRNGPDAVTISTLPEGLFLDVSDNVERLTGYSREELVGKSALEINIWVNPVDRVELVKRLHTEGTVRNLETSLRARNGEIRNVQLSAEIIMIEGKEYMLTVAKDITLQKLAEAALKSRILQQAVVANLGVQALSGIGLSRLFDEAVNSIAKYLDTEYVKVLELLPDGKQLLLRAGVGWQEGLVGQVIVESGSDSQAGFTLLSHEPVVVEDMHTEKRFSGPSLLVDHDVVSGISVIIGRRNQPYGVLGAHTTRKRIFTEEDINFMQAVANVLGEVFVRYQTEETLQFTQFAIDHISDASFWIKGDAGIVYVNDAACESLGYSREELLNMTIPDIDPDFPASKWADYWKSTGHLKYSTFETRHRRKDGTTFPVEIRSNHLEYQGTEYRCTFARDITKRKQTDMVLHRTHRALSVLSECNRAMMHATDEHQLLNDICRTIVETGNYRMAWVGYAEQDEKKTVRPVAHWGYEQGYLESLNITWADEERGHGPTGKAIRSGKTYVARNIHTDPNFAPWRAAALERSYGSSVAIPLVKGERVFGALMIYAQEPGAFDMAEMELLEDLADNLVYGIIALRTELEQKQAEKSLQESERKFSTAFRSSPDAIAITSIETGRIIDVNQVFEHLSGYSRNEIVGQMTFNLAVWINIKDREEIIRILKRDGLIRDYEVKFMDRSGGIRLCNVSSELFMLEDEQCAISIIRDVSKQKQAEKALQRNEEYLRFLYQENPSMYFTVAPDGQALSVNDFGASELGYTVTELTGKSILKIFPENEHENAIKQLQVCLKNFSQLHEWEIQKVCKNGKKIWVKETARAVETPDGKTAILIVCRDITERKKVEKQLQQNDQRLRNAQRIAHIGFWDWDIVTNEVYWSDETFKIFGIRPQEFTATYDAFLQAVHPLDRVFVNENIDKAIKEGAEYDIEHRIVLPDGSIKYVKEQGEVSYDQDGAAVRMVGTVSDITERKLAADEIQISQNRLRNLATRLQAIREDERARIAREIHDELGQTLTGLKMDLVWIREHIPKNLKKIPARVDSMISLVDTKLDDTRQLAFRLRPAMLDDLGLDAAIECEIQDFAKRAGCEYTLDLMNGDLGQDRDRDTALFRILQEALTNVARHAKATRIDITLHTSNSELVMTVRDNGVGIDMHKVANSDSLGLIGMQERAGALGGQINIFNVKEGGTQVTVKMPFAKN